MKNVQAFPTYWVQEMSSAVSRMFEMLILKSDLIEIQRQSCRVIRGVRGEVINSGLKTIHQQIYGYRASAYLVPSNHLNDVSLQQEIEERRRKRQTEETSLVTNIVFFLLCLLILVIIFAIVWFRFLKPRIEK